MSNVDPDVAPDRHLKSLDQAEQIAGLGTWEWTPETNETWWSANLFRMFGLRPDEIAPSTGYMRSRIVPEDQPAAQDAIAALRAHELVDHVLEYRILRHDGTVRAHQVVLIAIDSTPGQIIGSVRDVTAQRRLDRQLAAHLAVSQALDRWTSLKQGAQLLLGNLAIALEVEFGVFWLHADSSLHVPTICHAPSPALTRVVELTRLSRRTSALAIRACESGHTVIYADMADAPRGDDRDLAVRAAGLRGAIAVPAVFADETMAVMEFLSFEPVSPTERLLSALDGIGHELGRFLSSRTGELNAPLLTPRELEVLQLAAQGRSSTEIASELYLSSSTVKRHFENIYAGLGVRDRSGAVGEAMRRGLIT